MRRRPCERPRGRDRRAAGAARLRRLVTALPILLALPAHAEGQASRWVVHEVARYGSPELDFGAISDVGIDASGRLWILDGQAGELFAAAAGTAERVATAGSGPGELSPGPLELVILPGDTVLVVEPHARRWLRFDPAGGFVVSGGVGAVEGLTVGWRNGRPGELLARVNLQTMMRPDAAPNTGDPVMRFDGRGVPLGPAVALAPARSFRMGPGGQPSIELLGAQPVWDAAPSGLVVTASTDQPAVAVHAPGTSPDTIMTGSGVPSPVGPDMEARARALLRETLAARRVPAAIAEALVEAAAVADAMPVLGGVLLGPGGTVWVQRAAESAEELVDLERPGGPRWDVYAADGTPAGAVVLPAGFRPTGRSGDRVFGVTLDALGRTAAVLLRVESSAGAP